MFNFFLKILCVVESRFMCNEMTWKESGRIRGRFSRNIGIYNKGWKIIDDSCAFLNAIRLIVILITGKSVKFYQSVYCFFKIWFWIIQYDPFHTIINKFYLVFKELSPGLVSSNFEMCYGCVFQKWIYCINWKNGEMTQRYLKSYFSVYVCHVLMWPYSLQCNEA